jgi:hypothetical protein
MVKYVDSDHPSVVHPPHYLHELPQEDEERLENLFKSLDVDGNGKIDIRDLSVALRESGVNQTYAKVRCDCATLTFTVTSLQNRYLSFSIKSRFLGGF